MSSWVLAYTDIDFKLATIAAGSEDLQLDIRVNLNMKVWVWASSISSRCLIVQKLLKAVAGWATWFECRQTCIIRGKTGTHHLSCTVLPLWQLTTWSQDDSYIFPAKHKLEEIFINQVWSIVIKNLEAPQLNFSSLHCEFQKQWAVKTWKWTKVNRFPEWEQELHDLWALLKWTILFIRHSFEIDIDKTHSKMCVLQTLCCVINHKLCFSFRLVL